MYQRDSKEKRNNSLTIESETRPLLIWVPMNHFTDVLYKTICTLAGLNMHKLKVSLVVLDN